jgi:hypothetical protein
MPTTTAPSFEWNEYFASGASPTPIENAILAWHLVTNGEQDESAIHDFLRWAATIRGWSRLLDLAVEGKISLAYDVDGNIISRPFQDSELPSLQEAISSWHQLNKTVIS